MNKVGLCLLWVKGCTTSRSLSLNKTKICQEGARKQVKLGARKQIKLKDPWKDYFYYREEVEKRNALSYTSDTEIVKIAENLAA